MMAKVFTNLQNNFWIFFDTLELFMYDVWNTGIVY